MASAPSNARGIAAKLFATASFVACDTFMKLVTDDLPPFEVLFLRGVAGFICCAGLFDEVNAFVGYRFSADAKRILAGTAIRFGVVNLTDKVPPLTSDFQAYTPTVYNHLLAGRTWTLQLTRDF